VCGTPFDQNSILINRGTVVTAKVLGKVLVHTASRCVKPVMGQLRAYAHRENSGKSQVAVGLAVLSMNE
jgi:hypothetical protein